MNRFSLSGVMLLSTLLLLMGCGTSSINPPGSTGGNDALGSGFSLPAPAELHLTSAETSSPFQYGDEYAASLPNDRINPGVDKLVFWPVTDAQTHEVSPAYAMYLIDLPEYGHEPVVRVETGSQETNAWIGFANFASNRWDWQQLDAVASAHYQNTFDRALHVKNSQVLVAIVAMNTMTVEWLVAGDTTKLYTTDVQPKIMQTGDQVEFAAEFRYSAAEDYHWEFGSGVSPSVSYNAEPIVVAQAPGVYSGTLEVSNALSTDSFNFSYEIVAVQAIPPMHLQAVPSAASAAVDQPVRITVRCGRFPTQEQLHSCQVCLELSDHASYVAGSFNLGTLAGGAFDIDGIWSKLVAPPTDWIETPDAWFGAVESETPGKVWMMFGSAAIDAGETFKSGEIYSIEVVFDAPGVYEINFASNTPLVRNNFTDVDGYSYLWYDISNSIAPTITVTQ